MVLGEPQGSLWCMKGGSSGFRSAWWDSHSTHIREKHSRPLTQAHVCDRASQTTFLNAAVTQSRRTGWTRAGAFASSPCKPAAGLPIPLTAPDPVARPHCLQARGAAGLFSQLSRLKPHQQGGQKAGRGKARFQQGSQERQGSVRHGMSGWGEEGWQNRVKRGVAW